MVVEAALAEERRPVNGNCPALGLLIGLDNLEENEPPSRVEAKGEHFRVNLRRLGFGHPTRKTVETDLIRDLAVDEQPGALAVPEVHGGGLSRAEGVPTLGGVILFPQVLDDRRVLGKAVGAVGCWVRIAKLLDDLRRPIGKNLGRLVERGAPKQSRLVRQKRVEEEAEKYGGQQPTAKKRMEGAFLARVGNHFR